MSTERAEFAATLDVSGVEAGVARARAIGEEGIGGALTETFEKAHGGARHLAGGISALTGALGDSASEAGKLVGELGHVAGLAAVGGPLTAGIGIATFALGELYTAWKQSREGEKAFEDSIPGMITTIHTLQESALEPGRKAVVALGKELADFGKNARQIAIDNEAVLKLSLDRQLNSLDRARSKSDEDLVTSIKAGAESDIFQTAKETSLLIDRRLAEVKAARAETIGTLDLLKKEDSDLTAKEAAKKASTFDAAHGDDKYQNEISALLRREKLLDDIDVKIAKQHDAVDLARNKRDLDENQALLDKKLAAQTEYENECADVVRHATELQEKIVGESQAIEQKGWDELSKHIGDSIQMIAGDGVDALNSFISASIQGNKNAAKEAEIAFLKQVGGQLVGMGVRDTFTGAGMIITGEPAGAPMLALGLLEGATGLAMGAASTFMVGAPPSSSGSSGGSNGKDFFGSFGSSRGSSPRGSSGGSSGGGGSQTIVYEVNYGVMGPGAEDVARAVTQAQRLGVDRGFVDSRTYRGR